MLSLFDRGVQLRLLLVVCHLQSSIGGVWKTVNAGCVPRRLFAIRYVTSPVLSPQVRLDY